MPVYVNGEQSPIVRVPSGQSFDVLIAGTKEIDYATAALAFQQATVISTTSGDLTESPSGVKHLTKPFRHMTNSVCAVFTKASIEGNTATDLFTITTVDEAGNADYGGYYCVVNAIIGHRTDSDTGQGAVKGFSASFARHMLGTGAAGTNTAVTELHESAEAGNDTGTRGLGTVTMTVVETSEYVMTIQFTIDLTGTNVSTAEVTAAVEIVWVKFLTAPVLAAA